MKTRRVGIGLHLVLLGKIVMVLTMLLALRHPAVLVTPKVFALSITVGFVVSLGHALCLAAPAESGARPPLWGALVCNLVGNGLHIVAQAELGGVALRLVALTLKWFSFILFMAFMIRLAGWLERRDLLWMVHSHRALLVAGFVLVVVGGPLPFALHGPALAAVAPSGLVCVALGLLAYLGLVLNLALSFRRLKKA